MKTVLIIAMRNTCRSVIAEGVMKNIIEKEGLQHKWHVFSAFTFGSQATNMADKRAVNVLKRHGIEYHWHSRKVLPEDFHKIDYIFCMDETVRSEIKVLAPKNARARILMLGDFGLSRWDRHIMNPYHLVGDVGFEIAYRQCCAACDAFLKYALVDQI